MKGATWSVNRNYYGVVFSSDFEDATYVEGDDEMAVLTELLLVGSEMGRDSLEIVEIGPRMAIMPVSLLLGYTQSFSGTVLPCR